MDTMSVFPRLVLAFDFLQACSLDDVIKDILDLSRGDRLIGRLDA